MSNSGSRPARKLTVVRDLEKEVTAVAPGELKEESWAKGFWLIPVLAGRPFRVSARHVPQLTLSSDHQTRATRHIADIVFTRL
ncbi:hypothetical protein PG993_009271 [Apiospora rasikravindrae]|uniref:Uncharacterized protein n=1 Tax=Apiospora rasikravindrae TaxID=990691 RepID=A0ABR1SIW9_9PEZI